MTGTLALAFLPAESAGSTILGLLELVGWITLVLALAASLTYALIKLTRDIRARRGAENTETPPV